MTDEPFLRTLALYIVVAAVIVAVMLAALGYMVNRAYGSLPPQTTVGVIMVPVMHENAGVAAYIFAPYSTSAELELNLTGNGMNMSLPVRVVAYYPLTAANASSSDLLPAPYGGANYVAAFGGLIPNQTYSLNVSGYINHVCLSRICPLYVTPVQRVHEHLSVRTGPNGTLANVTINLSYSV